MNQIEKYANFFENIDETTPLESFREFFDSKSFFKDPFHEVVGLKNIYKVFQKMYENLENPHFKVLEIIQEKNIAYIRWDFIFTFKNENKTNSFTGVSRVSFDENYMVICHEDYWDAAQNIYEKLPFIKHLIKIVKNKIKE